MVFASTYSTPTPSASLKDRCKIIFGAVFFPIQTLRWKRFIARSAVLSDLARMYPRMLHKIYRPYVSGHLGCRERVDALIQHYSAVLALGMGPVLERAAVEPVILAEVFGKSGRAVQLGMRAVNVLHREGELALELALAGETVFTVAFSVVQDKGQAKLCLGALQGLRSGHGPEVVKMLTKELYGWRPKSFLIACLRALGEIIGSNDIILVSNANRVAINPHRRRRISADYDRTWAELSADFRADGNFQIPCREPAPDFSTIPANKRSEMRKRLALFALVRTILKENFARIAPYSGLEREELPRTWLDQTELIAVSSEEPFGMPV